MKKEKSYFVYLLLDPRYGPPIPFYVGISYKNKNRYRPKEHILEVKRKNERHKNVLKISVIKKILECGLEPIITEVFESNDKDEAIFKEIELISLYGRRDLKKGPLTNLTDGGEGATNMSENGKQKLRDRLQGKTLEEIHGKEKGDKLIQIKKEFYSHKENNPMYGKNHTEESKQKMSENKKGKIAHPISDKQKEAIRLSNSTRTISDKVKERGKQFLTGNTFTKGKKLSEEQKKKISKTRIEKEINVDKIIREWYHDIHGERIYSRKNLINEFPELRSDALSRVISGKYKHHKGWKLISTL